MPVTPLPGLLEIARCPLCRSTERTRWLDALGIRLCRCESCGHRYSQVVLTPERLSHDYYQEPDAHLAARAISAKRQRYGEYARALPSAFSNHGRVLDVGCNAGELLSLFKADGWQVEGVELSPGPAAYARRTLQAPVWTGPIEEFVPVGAPFDLVTMIHLLEHLHDPVSCLERIRQFIAPTGTLLIEVPNADDWLLKVHGGTYRALCPGDHVSFFDTGSLTRLLSSTGWRVAGLTSPMHARDILYGSALSLVDAVRARTVRASATASGVERQFRYRGQWRRPLRHGLDKLLDSVDPAIAWASERVAPARGAAIIAWAVRA